MRNKRSPLESTPPHKTDKWLKKRVLQRNHGWKRTLLSPAQATNVETAALTLLLLLLRALHQPRQEAKSRINESDLRRIWPPKIQNHQEVYMKYEFTFTVGDDEPCPKHMSCLEIGAKDGMKSPAQADIQN